MARGDGGGVAGEGGHATSVGLLRRVDGVGDGQVGDQRAAVDGGEDAGYGGRDGVVDQALHVGDVDPAVVDEIEAGLHPALVRQLVRLFQDSETNPRGAQLIFNSHEASLLGDSGEERVLGRDQVWFTEKSDDGVSRLYALSDLSPRIDEAIGRRYLAGRYGATPVLADRDFTEVAISAAGDPE